jgi:ABC-type lipoprotein release transport system permease subunit
MMVNKGVFAFFLHLNVLAIKNLKRRPLKTAMKIGGLAATAAVMLVWGSLTGGFKQTLEQAATALEIGEIQVHKSGYLENADIYEFFSVSATTFLDLEKKNLHASPRLYSFALAAAAELSAGVRVEGLVPELEMSVTSLHKHLEAGDWLSASVPKGVVVGKNLARQLEVKQGSEVVILSQALDGALATDVFTVRGILQSVSSDIDNRGVFTLDSTFRDLFLMPTGVHELAISRSPRLGNDELDDSKTKIAKLLKNPQMPSLEVLTWRELKPLLARMLDLLSVTSYFTLIFTYVALGGLILNMTFMTIYDRMKEYGMMKAVGMTPNQLIILIMAESFYLALAAGLLAWMVGLPCAVYFQQNGLDLSFMIEKVAFAGMNLEPILFAHLGLKQALAPILFLVILLPLFGLYPAREAASLSPIEALRHQ